MYSGYSSGASNTDIRRTATAHTRQPQPIQTQALTPDTSMNAPGSSSRRNNPDWAEFYKNGVPKEIIVIDDDDEEPAPPPPRQPALTRTATNGSLRHADKKRKTTASTAYDPVYNQHTSYSTTQTPGYYDSPNHSTSTDRTTSALNTTAATSLGSQVSNGQHHISPLDNTAVGQKRKRTRAVAQDEAKQSKRRELDHDDNPFSLYQPPPNPVIKAKDVYVNVVADVRPGPAYIIFNTDSSQKSYTKDQKVDDEDGHYVVVPDADLTERCACRFHLHLCYR